MKQHIVTSDAAPKVWEWLQTRGGIAVWESINLSNPCGRWTAPIQTAEGTLAGKPNWQCASVPARLISDPNEVVVSIDREVKRFHVAIRLGAQGLMYKVTVGGTRRIRAAVAKAGEGAYHVFDYETQEAVIMAPEKQMPIAEYIGCCPICGDKRENCSGTNAANCTHAQKVGK